LIPWLQVENVPAMPSGKYIIHVNYDLKNLCDTYRPGVRIECAIEFHKRLRREITRRRKEVDIVKLRGRWVPDNFGKMDLVRILDWIECELDGFHNGQSVNGRDSTDTPPQMIGQGVMDHGNEDQI
jgi:hypothetical protein